MKISLIPELRKPNAQVSLLFLDASEVLYSNKTYDPWFSATTNVPDGFVADEPVGILGCVTQRRYCNPNLPGDIGCSIYLSTDIDAEIERSWPDASDQSVMRGLLAALNEMVFELLVAYYHPDLPSLLSRSTIVYNQQRATIPKDRWQDEREHLYKASLAGI